MVQQSDTPSTSGSQWNNISSDSLDSILSSRRGLQSLLELRGKDAMAVINVLDRTLDSPTITPRQQRKYSISMRKLCGACGLLPTSHILTEGLEVIGNKAYESGGFADVWRGRYKGRDVAIKALRTYATDDLAKVKKRFCKEALVWKRLSHPNVLPFLGVSTSVSPFCMVSHWMTHGNVVEYVKAHPGANRLVLLCDVTGGLCYLHETGLVHGDLKGANILINSDFRACLADFGLMTIIPDAHTTYSTTTTTHGGTVRWMAPELLLPEEYGFKNSNPSKASDIYAIGMVIYEVMTGTVPFNQYGNLAVIPRVTNGVRPERPIQAEVLGLTDTVWRLMEACWNHEWNERPPVSAVLSRLNEASRYWNPRSPTTASVEIGSHDSESDASSLISDDVFDTQQSIHATQEPGHSEVIQQITAHEHNLGRPSTPTTDDESPSADSGISSLAQNARGSQLLDFSEESPPPSLRFTPPQVGKRRRLKSVRFQEPERDLHPFELDDSWHRSDTASTGESSRDFGVNPSFKPPARNGPYLGGSNLLDSRFRVSEGQTRVPVNDAYAPPLHLASRNPQHQPPVIAKPGRFQGYPSDSRENPEAFYAPFEGSTLRKSGSGLPPIQRTYTERPQGTTHPVQRQSSEPVHPAWPQAQPRPSLKQNIQIAEPEQRQAQPAAWMAWRPDNRLAPSFVSQPGSSRDHRSSYDPPGPAYGERYQTPPPLPPPEEQLPSVRPAWRKVKPQSRKRKSREPQDIPMGWDTWKPDPRFAPSPPPIEPLMLVPDMSSPGLFGPRSPKASVSSAELPDDIPLG